MQISVKSVRKIYTGIEVLNIPHLEIASGESIGLIGNNGAGKTTLFRAILDLIALEEGQIFSGEYEVSSTEKWKKYTAAYLGQEFLIPFLTAEEYFDFVSQTYGLPKGSWQERIKKYEGFFRHEVLGTGRYLRELSRGNMQKVGVMAAMLIEPKVLILDEPFASLDPSSQINLKEFLRQLHQTQNITMLISSHDLGHITEVAERILILDDGKIVKDQARTEETLNELHNYFKAPKPQSLNDNQSEDFEKLSGSNELTEPNL
ncbi:MAG: ABC transporter ATP-binding protein [Bernardetiaceae bacterium]|nr:ABC transporter ATP-binding protein [Bernardetiaceae bacterium]